MSIEIPNAFAAAGGFNPIVSSLPTPPFVAGLTPIVSSMGIQPYDPSGTPLDPKGGITTLLPGSYVVKMVDPIDALEGAVLVDAVAAVAAPGDPPEAPFYAVTGVGMIVPVTSKTGVIAAQLPAGTDDYKSVLVALSLFDGGEAPEPIDFPFQLCVFRYATGPKFNDLIA